MSNTHLSAAPNDPYEWRESVLSTRSLSYLSTADALGSPGQTSARNISSNYHRPPTRRSTEMTDDSDYGLETASGADTELRDIPELPESVTESPLFLLPREIRDRIYSFCLTAQDGLPVEWPTLWKAYNLQPQLLRTCRIIYSEAAHLLFTLNNMTFHHPSDANMFVRAISNPALARHTSSLSLHIKAQDTRLWMPYLTSKDIHRSLKADFPALRELSIRYRSGKWQPGVSPERNLELWSEDSRLEEIIDGLRHVFLSTGPKDVKNEQELETYISNHASDYPLDPSVATHKEQWLAIHKARADFARKQDSAPIIKVVCACRIQGIHFTTLTTAPTTTEPAATDLSQANNGTGVIQQTPIPPSDPPAPVLEGEPFHGFRPIDLRAGIKKLQDPDLGSANVARTPFADMNGILLSLEVHCLDPKRDNAAEQRNA